jgi:uncharacterized protein YgiM (DUF1202 family)
MERDDDETLTAGPVFRAVRAILPWAVLLVVVWVLAGVWSGFQRSKEVAATAVSTEPTVTAPTTAPSVITTITGMTALVRTDVKLRSQPNLVAEVLATSKKGSKLTVLAKQSTWFRVKDAAGHIGWIPNDSKYIEVRVN